MNLSGGFYVVVSVGTLLVAVPFALLMFYLWRLSFWGRSVVFIAATIVVGLAAAIYSSEPFVGKASTEENVVIFLGMWGLLFYLLVSVAGVVALAKKIFHQKTTDLAHGPEMVDQRKSH